MAGELILSATLLLSIFVYGWLNNRHVEKIREIAREVGRHQKEIRKDGEAFAEYHKDLEELKRDILLPIGLMLKEMKDIDVQDRERIVAYVKWIQEQQWQQN